MEQKNITGYEKEYESKIQEAETIKDESILKAATHHYEKQKQKEPKLR